MPEARKRLGEILIERGVIDRHQLKAALTRQQRWGHKLGETLVHMGMLTEAKLAEVLSEHFRVPQIDISNFPVDREALKLLKPEFCREHNLMPVAIRSIKGKIRLVLATADPSDLKALDEAAFASNQSIAVMVAPISDLKDAVRHHYESEVEGRSEITLAKLKPEEREVEVFRAGGQELLRFDEEERERVRSGVSYPSMEMRFRSLVDLIVKKGLITEEEAQNVLNAL